MHIKLRGMPASGPAKHHLDPETCRETDRGPGTAETQGRAPYTTPTAEIARRIVARNFPCTRATHDY